MPAGYEFSTLIEDILMVSQQKSALNARTLDELKKLTQPVSIQVFVTPTCPYCPRAVVLAHQLALASDLITASMVEANEFPHLSSKYQVYGVPRTVIADVIHVEGAVPEAMLVEELMKVLDPATHAGTAPGMGFESELTFHELRAFACVRLRATCALHSVRGSLGRLT